ncbi:hypothetical protein [uncultured Draconibacterium sp.]|uniref:hypothetical protein n=1 Tax=uncultured Draconibacterium sp. TaxID=1573823 RepID=UPI0029C5FD11|nr:hypothetical protein [uncultured Draconibacterium sp.]
MKKTFIIILILALFGFVAFFIANNICKIEDKCPNCPKISRDKEYSQQMGFYITDYKNFIPEFKLKYHNENVKLNDVWIEKQWYFDFKSCLCPKLRLTEGFNVIIDFEKSNEDSFYFSLTPMINGKLDKTNGGIEKGRKTMKFEFFPDEIYLQLKEKNPNKDIGWKEGIVTDTLIIKLKK